MTQFRGLLGKYPNLKVHLENYYRDVLDFHRNALDVFSRPSTRYPLFSYHVAITDTG